ncbi:S1C family serine protease [Sulfuriroseicoccus oceanibius]|uniref:Trypsin-like peptidase domain-containing protein n=1 Tax=Sulfuriroseicoccus oceanibius TaxID=2707525 RepID=A0A6B3L136_9BACT|nr:trypsin-like peptidase domain-containing protein [Sulfuriroseicoccus oceanibius]QQL44135.1 trypsin-like peptidase domain-containing protein [Sulfuriroseicoccus oceanibius]
MSKTHWTSVRALGAGVVAMGLAVVCLTSARAREPQAMDEIQVSAEAPIRTGPLGGYSAIVEKVSPSVVSIATSRMARQYQRDLRTGRINMIETPVPQGLGSGVLVNRSGIVVTNNHVIEGATVVNVQIQGRKEPVHARVLGVDPSTDLAVLKVEGDDLPAAVFADSDTVKPGDLVLAIGSPFGLEQSVTSGIVSATGRSDLGIVARGQGYEDFIQTDASINPGNSGGALIDNRGRVIGINTAILSRSGGNVGIGLAIPTDMVLDVVEQIVKFGEIRRGYLGVVMNELDLEAARRVGLDDAGVVVRQVVMDSPAFVAGIRAGDVILSINEEPVDEVNRLRLEIAKVRPGDVMKFSIWRAGEIGDVDVKAGQRPVMGQQRLRWR